MTGQLLGERTVNFTAGREMTGVVSLRIVVMSTRCLSFNDVYYVYDDG